MEDWDWTRRLRYGGLQALGLGMLAGGFEAAALGRSLALPLTLPSFLALGLLAVACMAAVAGAAAMLVGAPLHLALRSERTSRAVAWQLGATAAVLSGWYLWQGAAQLLAQDAPIGAAAMAAMPLGFAGVITVNARYWLRRAELERPSKVGWLAAAGILSAALVIGGAGLQAARDTGGSFALEGDASVVLVTVDSLRHDASMPTLDALATSGVRFTDAVSPTPGPRPANASVLSGLHPLRHRVVSDTERLPGPVRTLAETLAAEGYATAAFVSARTVAAGSGLDQGFRVFDDDFSPALPGLDRVSLPGRAVDLWIAAVGRARSSWAGRDAAATVDRYRRWAADHADLPSFAWIHLVAGAAGAGDADAAVGRVVEGLVASGALDRTLIIVAGTHGDMQGEHGLHGPVSLYDPALRVPLVVKLPGPPPAVTEVAAQVRIMDIAATVLDGLRMDPLGASEGVSLVEYATGDRRATVSCPLLAPAPEGGWLVGVRNNGVKYIRAPDGGERLFDLAADPGETTDIAASMPGVLEQARRLLAPDLAALDALGGR